MTQGEAETFWIGAFLGFVAGCLVVALAILLDPRLDPERAVAEERKKAQEANVGRWVILDPATGKKGFIYGGEKPK